MENEILSATQFGGEFASLLMPFISALLLLVITLWFKDFAGKIAKGLAFKMSGTFKEGDKVIIDGERGLIVKIGLTQTVFGIYKEKDGIEEDYCWRYVPNERISLLKIEKVIFDHTKTESKGE